MEARRLSRALQAPLRSETLRVSIVGSGVVGKATGFGLRARGHFPVFFDIDPKATENLKDHGLLVAESLADSVTMSSIIMICVPTPTVDGRMGLGPILDASRSVGTALRDTEDYKVVVVRSTVLPGTTRDKVLPNLEAFSGKKVGQGFGLCVNPEFLRQTNALTDFLSPDRVVIGEFDHRSGTALESVYRSTQRPIVRCTLEEAELAKHVCNAFLAAKISYFNEVFKICRKIGADPGVIGLAAALDHRIGGYGTAGGRPFAGACLPKDLEAFISFIKGLGESPKVLDVVARVNEELLEG